MYFPRPISLRTSTETRSTFLIAALILATLSTSTFAQDAGEGLPRFSQVSDRLYRGAQPRAGGLQRLVEMNINTVINLRGIGKETRTDEAEAKRLGLRYFNVPMPTWGRPKDSVVSRVLEIVSDPENGRVFIHCKDGVDRTGMMIALYRISAEGWTAASALEEARSNGMRGTQIWMRDYVEDYYDRTQFKGQSALVSNHAHEPKDLGDKLGIYARFGEQFTSRATRVAKRVLRRVF